MGNCGLYDRFSDDENPSKNRNTRPSKTGNKETPRRKKKGACLWANDEWSYISSDKPTGRDLLRPEYVKSADILCRFRPVNANEDGTECVQYKDLDPENKLGDDWGSVGENDHWEKLTKASTVCEVQTPKSIASGKTYHFEFDRLFPPKCRNQNVYNVLREQWFPLLMEGRSIGVIAYGISGSGKSHTVHGNNEDPGIVPLFCEDLFNRLETSEDFTNTVRVQFLEIFDEKIVDLLQERNETGRLLPSKQNKPQPELTVSSEDLMFSSAPVPAALNLEVKDQNELSDTFWKGYWRLRREKVTEGLITRQSSRSHSVFICTVVREDDQSCIMTTSQFYVVDLAGPFWSSDLKHVQNQRVAKRLNQSLVAFRKVMLFSDIKSCGRHKPYRDSTVTRIIQPVLERGKTCLMLNVSGSSQTAKKTIETLRFGFKASKLAERRIIQNVSSQGSAFEEEAPQRFNFPDIEM